MLRQSHTLKISKYTIDHCLLFLIGGRILELPRENKTSKRCSEVIEDRENVLISYDDRVQTTASGKYRCRDCGKLFDTLEEHDAHHRKVHRHAEIQSSPGMAM